MTKPNREQSGLYNLFARYVKEDGTIIHAGFAKDIEALREYGDNLEALWPSDAEVDTPSPFIQFVNKYDFPSSMHMFLLDYVTDNEINPDKLTSGVYVVDEDTEEASGRFSPSINYLGYSVDSLTTKYIRLTLAVPVDATNLQIKEAVKDAKDFIKAKQTKLNGGRVARKRFSINAERNNWLLEQDSKGLSPKQILHKLPQKWQGTIHTSQDISDILNHLKNK
jgi:hypothetical protein